MPIAAKPDSVLDWAKSLYSAQQATLYAHRTCTYSAHYLVLTAAPAVLNGVVDAPLVDEVLDVGTNLRDTHPHPHMYTQMQSL